MDDGAGRFFPRTEVVGAIREGRTVQCTASDMSVHILDAMSREGFEEVVAIHDRASGLRAFLGIHDTTAGPAFGGIRRWGYVDERQALLDCLRLSRSMTHKCALAEVPGGGGKLVVLDQPELDREGAYRHIGRVVERLGGRYYTGPDVGTSERELEAVAAETRFVTQPGPAGPGDLAGATAEGVYAGIAAALRHLDGAEDWAARTVVVQGLGAVGAALARRLVEQGARVVGSDLDPVRADAVADELGLELAAPSEEFGIACDVFAPCALGGGLHDLTVSRMRARVVAGAANNPLAKTLHGDRLHERGILYVPDFVLNAGALIRGATFHLTGRREALGEIERRVGGVTERILQLATGQRLSPMRVAVEEAERLIRERRQLETAKE